MKNKLTQKRLKKLLYYNPDTGIFTWKINSRRSLKDAPAGNLHPSGYIRIGIDSKEYRAHRLAFLYMEGYIPENDVDHINRVRDDNRWKNLRELVDSAILEIQVLEKIIKAVLLEFIGIKDIKNGLHKFK